MYLSVIIPAYNEAERIGKTLYAVSDYFRTALYKYEIIVVNDGSADATQEIVNELTVSIPYLTQISYTQNRGKGWAVKQGMLKAKGKYRLFMDADNSTAIKYVEELLREAETSDVVIGSRRISGARITLSQPLYREFLGYVFRALVHAIVPLDVSDSQNGFKLFTAEAAEIIFRRQRISRWAFDVEILALAHLFGYTTCELPIVWANDKRSRVTFLGMIHMFFEVVAIRINLWCGVYYTLPPL